MKNIKRAINLVWQSSPKWMIANITFNFIQSILPIGLLYIIKLIVDRIALSISIKNKQEIFADIILLLINAGVIILWNNLNTVITELCSTTLAQKVTDYMQIKIFQKAIAIDLESYESPEKQDILERATWEAPHRPTRMLSNLTTAFQNVVSLIVISGILISLNWRLFAILLLASIPTMFIRFWQSKSIYKWQRRQTEIERKANYFGHLLLGDQPAKEIRLFNLGDFFIQRFYHIRQQLFKEKLVITIRQSLMRLISQGFTGLLMIATYLFIIHQTIYGKFQLGDLVLYSQAFQRGQNALRELISSLSGLHENNLFLSDIFNFLALKNGIDETMYPKPMPSKIQQGIVFDNVSFRHQNSSRKAIKQVNLKIAPKEVIALVGENGSGKTTLVKLLCRLYDVTSGSITIDGINVKDFKINDLQRQISVIFQDYNCYQLTAKENIWLGNIDLSPDSPKIIESSQYSGADAIIKDLPQEYETQLGKWFKGGEQLSGGQWQKIALARAFLRDAQLVILDEPTSSLDAYGEAAVFQKFREIMGDRAVLLITHRLANVKTADRIYVLHEGEIVESGTHDQLMSLNGKYADLFTIQAKNYQ
ncbi:ABC transporter ATP-binding protein [Cronbergia sp. UHCC 0137]|uniref:ABC transporter ATP-binding protein n=1 Tax=Cronbergia sp. UHCC 0137 TaxID=3110239 RepID=UPI002B219D2C|nr:ABC transporter ATP-binding protein [Cronbergia sp. UHCC 0137]MEA5619911.1 ABC transporter ATP-binding protein [Cronbergia sp. UHCC 0137]